MQWFNENALIKACLQYLNDITRRLCQLFTYKIVKNEKTKDIFPKNKKSQDIKNEKVVYKIYAQIKKRKPG